MYGALPPLGGDVSLELHTERAVIIGTLKTTVDLAALEDEAAPLTKGDELRDNIV
jgi:hypothetical protein